MAKKVNNTSDAGEPQVFEITMDNPEDQDELNRRFRKPDDPNGRPTPKAEHLEQSPPTTDSTVKKKGKG